MFTTPLIDQQTGISEGQRFPAQFPPPGISPQHPDNNIDWSYFEPIASWPGFWHENVTPYSEEWNLSIQRQFGNNTVASVSYAGTEGHHLISSLEANPGNPARCLSVNQKSQMAPGSPAAAPTSRTASTDAPMEPLSMERAAPWARPLPATAITSPSAIRPIMPWKPLSGITAALLS
jgi:hypothetical protein